MRYLAVSLCFLAVANGAGHPVGLKGHVEQWFSKLLPYFSHPVMRDQLDMGSEGSASIPDDGSASTDGSVDGVPEGSAPHVIPGYATPVRPDQPKKDPKQAVRDWNANEAQAVADFFPLDFDLLTRKEISFWDSIVNPPEQIRIYCKDPYKLGKLGRSLKRGMGMEIEPGRLEADLKTPEWKGWSTRYSWLNENGARFEHGIAIVPDERVLGRTNQVQNFVSLLILLHQHDETDAGKLIFLRRLGYNISGAKMLEIFLIDQKGGELFDPNTYIDFLQQGLTPGEAIQKATESSKRK